MEIVSCSAAESKPSEAQGSQAAQCIPNSGCLLGFASSTFRHPDSKVLPQFYRGASKSLRIKPARQEPAVSGVIFKHLTVHETLRSCLAPSSIPPKEVQLFPRHGGDGISPAAPRGHRCLQQQDPAGTRWEQRASAPHTHWGDRSVSPSP